MADLNRRIHPRSLTDVRAHVQVNGTLVSCVIRDRSAGGARLVFRRVVQLPPRFELRERTAVYGVELVWFDGVQAGVRFT